MTCNRVLHQQHNMPRNIFFKICTSEPLQFCLTQKHLQSLYFILNAVCSSATLHPWSKCHCTPRILSPLFQVHIQSTASDHLSLVSVYFGMFPLLSVLPCPQFPPLQLIWPHCLPSCSSAISPSIRGRLLTARLRFLSLPLFLSLPVCLLRELSEVCFPICLLPVCRTSSCWYPAYLPVVLLRACKLPFHNAAVCIWVQLSVSVTWLVTVWSGQSVDLADPELATEGGKTWSCFKQHELCALFSVLTPYAFFNSGRFWIKIYWNLSKPPPENLLLSSLWLFDPAMPWLHQVWIKAPYIHYWLLFLKQPLQCAFPFQKHYLVLSKSNNHLFTSFWLPF